MVNTDHTLMKAQNIVVIDKDKESLDQLDYLLLKAGFRSVCFSDTNQALDHLYNTNVDCIITDWMQQDHNYYKLLEKLDQSKNTIKFMVSSEQNEDNAIFALQNGFDDYMEQPLRKNEFVVRVSKLLLKHKTDSPKLIYKELKIDKEKFEISVNNQLLQTSKYEFMVLELFIQNIGKVLSRQRILEYLNNGDYITTERSVDVLIFGLRNKIKKYFSGEIKSIYGVGYKMY